VVSLWGNLWDLHPYLTSFRPWPVCPGWGKTPLWYSGSTKVPTFLCQSLPCFVPQTLKPELKFNVAPQETTLNLNPGLPLCPPGSLEIWKLGSNPTWKTVSTCFYTR
jgi:hypothetical protein